jgi:hypothetical protein
VPGRFMVSHSPAKMWEARRAILERLYRQRLPGHQRRCERQIRVVSRSQGEDQQLGSTVDSRRHRVSELTIPAVLSTTNRAGQLSTTGPFHHDRRIDLAAICCSTLLYVGVVARCAAL